MWVRSAAIGLKHVRPTPSTNNQTSTYRPTYLSLMPFCDHCDCYYPTLRGVGLHVQRTSECFQKWTESLAALSQQRFQQEDRADGLYDNAQEEIAGADGLENEGENSCQ